MSMLKCIISDFIMFDMKMKILINFYIHIIIKFINML